MALLLPPPASPQPTPTNSKTKRQRQRHLPRFTIQTWFWRLIACSLMANITSILYFHHQFDELSSTPASQQQQQHEDWVLGYDRNANGNGQGMANTMPVRDDEDHVKTTMRNHNIISQDKSNIGKGERAEGSRNKQSNNKHEQDCVQGIDFILEEHHRYYHNETTTGTSTSSNGRIIPYKVHIILPFHIDKTCIPPRMHKTIQKWHLINHSIYIHDSNSIFNLAKQKYKHSSALSQFYHGLMGSSSSSAAATAASAATIIENKENEKYIFPCASVLDQKKYQHKQQQYYNEYNNMYAKFQNDMAKLLVLWEYGGLVISDLSYEPSEFLLNALEEEQVEKDFLLQQHIHHSNPQKSQTLQQHPKKRKRNKMWSGLFTTNTTQFIIETNDQFEFNKEFFASIPHHPLVHHLLTRTIQRYQKRLFNTTTSSSWLPLTAETAIRATAPYHHEETWNRDIYKHFVTRFYTHKFRKPTQISPPNENRWNYLLDFVYDDGKSSSINIADGDGVIATTITIFDRDKFDGQSLLKKEYDINAYDNAVITNTSLPSSLSLSVSPACKNIFAPISINITSLLSVVGTSKDDDVHSCPEPLKYIKNKLDPISTTVNIFRETTKATTATIPNIIHITGKTKCLSKTFHDSLQSWYAFPNHAVLYHDNNAVKRLLNLQEWTLFPQLRQVVKCVNSGAGLADVFRYLLLWEFGGIYTDIDNSE